MLLILLISHSHSHFNSPSLSLACSSSLAHHLAHALSTMTIGPPVDMTSTASVELSQPAPRVWVLKMERKPDNRLSPEMLAHLMQRLDEIEVEWRTMNKGKENKDKVGGSVIIASSVTKFWSNGFIPTFLRRPGFKEGEFTAERAMPIRDGGLCSPILCSAVWHGELVEEEGGVLCLVR